MTKGIGANGWRIAGWSVAGFLLLLPAVAMRFTSEMNWTASDFVFAAVMIGGVGLALELTVRLTGNWAYRGAVAIILAATFLLVWINGAVGIIGDEDNGANLMFGGVLAIALLGSVIARFRAGGMVWAMVAAAAAQAAIGPAALLNGWGADSPAWPWDVAGSTGFFTAAWLTAAWLFARAARDPASGEAASR